MMQLHSELGELRAEMRGLGHSHLSIAIQALKTG